MHYMVLSKDMSAAQKILQQKFGLQPAMNGWILPLQLSADLTLPGKQLPRGVEPAHQWHAHAYMQECIPVHHTLPCHRAQIEISSDHDNALIEIALLLSAYNKCIQW